MTETDVLVVGAGPTGLLLACDLARRGVAVRVVDQAPQFAAGSRGKGLSPRSLEVLDDLGVIAAVLASGVTHLKHRKYRGAEVVEEIDPYAGQVPTPDRPYPVGLVIPQWRVEQILRDLLASAGVQVELDTGVQDIAQRENDVTATTTRATITARYLVGCDGGRSTVRKRLGLPFLGDTPPTPPMAVGDVAVDGLDRDAWHQWFTGEGGIMLCPLPGTDTFQAQASHEYDEAGVPLPPTLERFQRTFDRFAGVPGVKLRDLTWSSSYRVNVRMVDRLRVGRVFLAGDAAHVHPIAGGLGMNTGIQDGYNLGWKLGLVLAGQASDALLDTYETERLPIASWLLSITSELLAVVLDAIERTGGGVDAIARSELSQLQLGYPWSQLSTGDTLDSGLQPGDRAPDARLADGRRIFDLFRGTHFTLLGPDSAVPASANVRAYHDLADPEGDIARTYGSGKLVLVRPDGYVGLVADEPEAVRAYLRGL